MKFFIALSLLIGFFSTSRAQGVVEHAVLADLGDGQLITRYELLSYLNYSEDKLDAWEAMKDLLALKIAVKLAALESPRSFFTLSQSEVSQLKIRNSAAVLSGLLFDYQLAELKKMLGKDLSLTRPSEALQIRQFRRQLKTARIFPGALDEVSGEDLMKPSQPYMVLDDRKSFLMLGRVTETAVELTHFNDFNLWGSLTSKLLGYPETDDFGRTSAILLKMVQKFEHGEIETSVENWLFSTELGTELENKKNHKQDVEEKNIVRIVSRQFLDSDGQKWVVVGGQFKNEVQQGELGAYVQEIFHTLNPGQGVRKNTVRSKDEMRLSAIVGVGGKFDILKNNHVDVFVKGELLSELSSEPQDSRLVVQGEATINFHPPRIARLMLSLSAKMQRTLEVNGTSEGRYDLRLGMEWKTKRWVYSVAGHVAVFDEELDRQYEGDVSWNTGLSLGLASRADKSRKIHYFFN